MSKCFMSTSSWTVEETHLLIRKRLELFGCARSDKVYDQISNYLVEQHNVYKNAANCQTRFNNLLKTYRTCVKRLDTGGKISKLRFPYFDTFHQYYGSHLQQHQQQLDQDGASSKCKSEIFLEDIFDDSSYADGGGMGGEGEGDSLMMDSTQQTMDDCDLAGAGVSYGESSPSRGGGGGGNGHHHHNSHVNLGNGGDGGGGGGDDGGRGEDELTTSLTANNGLEDLKLRLMEQKLLYYTNQNMLLQIKQEHYRQKEQDRARSHLMAQEILKVLKGIHSCLKKGATGKVGVKKKRVEKEIPPVVEEEKEVMEFDETKIKEDVEEEEEAEEEEEPEGGGLLIPVDAETDEEDDEDEDEECNGDGQSASGGSSEEVVKKPEVGRLKVRKNIFPPWNRIQTVLLIKIHCDLRPKFKGYNLFECVSNKLIEIHINRTPRDCRTRWNNLFRTYKECRLRLKLNDKAPVKFEYFDEIDAYFKDKEFLSPS